jgi:serine/threonine protein kinase
MIAMATRFFYAFRNATSSLKEYYEKLDDEPPLIPLSAEEARFPYPVTFTHLRHSAEIHFRLIHQLYQDKLIFLGITVPHVIPTILVKFVRRYGKDLHLHCAAMGRAPPLLGFQELPGGWNMVVMEFMANYRPLSTFKEQSMLSNLRITFMTLVDSFHKKNLVHGDLRATNVLVQKYGNELSMMLTDFDWAGSEGEVRYPLCLNRNGVRRPEGAVDGALITKVHDLQMASYMFPDSP